MENLFIEKNLKFDNNEDFLNIIKNLKMSYNKNFNSQFEFLFMLNRLKEYFDKNAKVQYPHNDNVLDLKFARDGKRFISGCFNFIDFCFNFLHLSSSSVFRLLKIYDKFYSNYEVQKHFEWFSVNKLRELVSIDIDILIIAINDGSLSPDMTIPVIRKFVNSISGEIATQQNNEYEDKKIEDNKEDLEKDIPMAYNPEQYYEFDYFKQQTKTQLLNIVWDLQNHLKKINKKIKG